MRRRLVAGNWKLHGSKTMCRELLGALVREAGTFANTDVAVCPPAVYIQEAQGLLQGTPVALGSQDVSPHVSGAHTGEISAAMLSEMGCTLALCGHSERRSDHQESDALVADKCVAAIAEGLTAVLCVGESEDQRERGLTQDVVGRQLQAVLDRVEPSALDKLIVAYEPVWAIGTGKTATPEQAQELHAFIRCQIARLDGTMAGRLTILYGGSVKANNAAELFAQPDIDGGLIGGASLDVNEFLGICRAGS